MDLVGSIKSQSIPPIKYTPDATASTASNDPNFDASHAAETDETMAERLEAIFMKALAVPPKRPPTSVTVAHETGSDIS